MYCVFGEAQCSRGMVFIGGEYEDQIDTSLSASSRVRRLLPAERSADHVLKARCGKEVNNCISGSMHL